MSENETRGVIRHQERAKQIISFEGMQYGSITPTDIDTCIEYKNVGWFWGEVKYNGAPVRPGQRLAIERFVDDMWTAGKHVLAVIADHNVDDANEKILLKDCIVREFRADFEEWKTPIIQQTVGELVKKFVEKMDTRIEGRCKA